MDSSSKEKFPEKPGVKSISDFEKSGLLNNSNNAGSCSKSTPNGLEGEGKNMYVNNLEYIDLSTPGGRLGGHVNVNHLEYIDASCFSSPALTQSLLGCDDEVSISSVLRELSSPEITRFEKQEDGLIGGELRDGGCKLSHVPMEGERRGGGSRDDEVSISSVLSNASPRRRKESKEAKKSSDEDAKSLKTDGPDDLSTGGGVKLKEKESALEDKKIATIENLNKWGFLR